MEGIKRFLFRIDFSVCLSNDFKMNKLRINPNSTNFITLCERQKRACQLACTSCWRLSFSGFSNKIKGSIPPGAIYIIQNEIKMKCCPARALWKVENTNWKWRWWWCVHLNLNMLMRSSSVVVAVEVVSKGAGGHQTGANCDVGLFQFCISVRWVEVR